MKTLRGWYRAVTPYQILVIGYALITLLGAVLLSLPISSAQGQRQPFIDSLFVAASGISTTGLTPVDIGSYYSLFGQTIVLCVFQIGGVGYMTFVVFLIYFLGIHLPFTARIVARESLPGSDFRMLERFFVLVLTATFVFEAAGAAALSLFWLKEYPMSKALYLGTFHSVSAFCTAGFGLFADSLMRYSNSVVVNLTIIAVSIAGGIGFFILYDLCIYAVKRFKGQFPRRLSLHTRITAIVWLTLMLSGAVIIFIAEKWPATAGWRERVMASVFQSVSASTTDGFNTVDIGKLGATSLTFLIILMFVGAAPGSTGGGIKVSTLGVILLFLWSQLRGREKYVNAFKREIPTSSIYKAFGVFAWFVIIAAADLLILSATEQASYLQIFFEVVSALGNTGLSTGITAGLTFTGKAMLIITMFIGRVGPLTAGLFLVGRQKPVLYQYATEDVFVG